MRTLKAEVERWPIAGAFTIARGSKTEAVVVTVEISEDGVTGRGEATPYPRYGETPESVLAEIEQERGLIEAGGLRSGVQAVMQPGAARNAVDCALWDLRAKREGRRVHEILGLKRLEPLKTAYTLSLAEPAVMAEQARANARRPLLKLKIGGPGDLDRVQAVREAAPKCRLIVDANEGLSLDELKRLAPEFARLGVKLIEQPLKAGEDEALEGYACPVPLCADESLHTRAELALCARLYKVANIKLDKAGGLTEALALKAEARAAGMEVMVGCMVATSLAIAPALIVAQGAEFVDLDGPLLLARDRHPGLTYVGSMIEPPPSALWG
jgi:L-alanine-DL-glutamate epimerase-like enolase superfamily enzyme